MFLLKHTSGETTSNLDLIINYNSETGETMDFPDRTQNYNISNTSTFYSSPIILCMRLNN